MHEYSYKLTLDVMDHGQRTFTVSREFRTQWEMQQEMALDIARSLPATMNSPPHSMEIASAIETEESLISGVARAYQAWDGNCDFCECVTIIVDFAKLKQEPDSDDAFTRTMLERSGIVLLEPKPLEPIGA